MGQGALVCTDPAAGLEPADRAWLDQQTAAIQSHLKRSTEHILEAGRILVAVRERLPYGTYLAWIGASLRLSPDTAQRWARVAEMFGGEDHKPLIAASDPYAICELARPSVPDVVRSAARLAVDRGERVTWSVVRSWVTTAKEPPAPAQPIDDDEDAPPPFEPVCHKPHVPAHHAAADGHTEACAECLGRLSAALDWLIPAPALIEWAEGVGGGVASHYHLIDQQAADVKQQAVLTMLAKRQQFDPRQVPRSGNIVEAFCGWAHPSVRCEAAREAERLRNGGTYHTTRTPGEAPRVTSLPEGV